jgi:threonyl-tRNA synthetase
MSQPKNPIEITLPDNSKRPVESGSTVLQLAQSIGPRLASAAVAAKVDGQARDLAFKLEVPARVEILTPASPEGLEVLRHSTSHLMAAAVKKLLPEAKVTIGPAVEDGFYYDFDTPRPLTEEDLRAIEKQMAALASAGLPFVRSELPSEKAAALFQSMGESYKAEIIQDLGQPMVSLYQVGDFLDLCRGPHIPSSDRAKVFKLTHVAGAYWRGNEKNKMLTRVYGTAFASQKEMDEHFARIEEAKKRDHRRLGKELGLFSFHEEGGAGLTYWHPKGALIRRLVEDFWRDEHAKNGYELVVSPHIGKADLWETSGHLGFYKDSMYAPMDIDGQPYYLKPMNCPFHILIYKTDSHSYKEFPLRFAELGTVYRYEKSGVLSGMLRVRGFTQDDAHLFMAPSQVKGEILRTVKFVLFMLRTFGFTEFAAYLATRPPEYVGDPATWDVATAALKEAAQEAGLSVQVDEGGGAFYGPKIDIKVKDSIGRQWQLSTVQVDFNLPERFDMKYVAEDGSHQRTVMIHRALLGSLERFFGILVEHYAGAFPLWLAPVQARVLTITNRQDGYAAEVVEKLKAAGLRADLDARGEKINAKVRDAQLEKIPYMLVVGDKEQGAGAVAVRHRAKGDQGARPLDEFLRQALDEVKSKS